MANSIMQSNQSDKTPYLKPSKNSPPRVLILFICLAVILGISSTAHAGFFSSLFSIGIQNAEASDQTASKAGPAGQSSQTMNVLEAPSSNPQLADNVSASSLPPIDGEVLSPDLASANQASGVDSANIKISSYTVQSDDTLSSIADMFDVSVDTVKQANPSIKGIDKGLIQPGDVLTILPVTGILYTVQSGDTLSGIAKKSKVDVSDILTYNEGLTVSSTMKKGTQLVIPNGKLSVSQVTSYLSSRKPKVPSFEPLLDPVWNWPTAPVGYYVCPVPGARLTQGLHGHNAVDLAIAYGTPIRAAAAGTVIVAKANGTTSSRSNGGYGSFVMISHGNGSETLYAHMSSVAVSVGEQVSQGQTIGRIGMTGMTTGPHTHFEIRGARNPFVDPALCR